MSGNKRVRDEESPVQTVRPKATDKKSKSAISDEGGEPKLHDLGKMKKVSVSEFKGQLLVNFREYYVDKTTGEEKPGLKGITLNRSQWEEFKKVIPELDAVFDADDE